MTPEANRQTFPSLGLALEEADAHAEAGRAVVLLQSLDHSPVGEALPAFTLCLDVVLIYAEPLLEEAKRERTLCSRCGVELDLHVQGCPKGRRVERSERRASGPPPTFYLRADQ